MIIVYHCLSLVTIVHYIIMQYYAHPQLTLNWLNSENQSPSSMRYHKHRWTANQPASCPVPAQRQQVSVESQPIRHSFEHISTSLPKDSDLSYQCSYLLLPVVPMNMCLWMFIDLMCH